MDFAEKLVADGYLYADDFKILLSNSNKDIPQTPMQNGLPRQKRTTPHSVTYVPPSHNRPNTQPI